MEQGKINLVTKDHVFYNVLADGQVDVRFEVFPINNIIVRLATFEDVMSLMVVANKIKNGGGVINYIYVTYLTPNNLNVIAPMINSINYRTIYINDPVWKVPFMIEKCCLENALSHLNYGDKNTAIVYPNQQLQSLYGVGDSYVYEPNMEIKEKTVRIITRSCPEPYTYYGMANEFRTNGKKVELVASYILDGLDDLVNIFDKVYTTNGFSELESSDKIEVFKLRS